MHDVLCVGRCAVPATLLSYVLGLSEDWLSRLPGSIQWYVSVSAKQPQGDLRCQAYCLVMGFSQYGIFFYYPSKCNISNFDDCHSQIISNILFSAGKLMTYFNMSQQNKCRCCPFPHCKIQINFTLCTHVSIKHAAYLRYSTLNYNCEKNKAQQICWATQ